MSKNIPLIVFLGGLSAMIYSMLTFFHPEWRADTFTPPVLPPGAGEIFTPTAREPIEVAKVATNDPSWEEDLIKRMHSTTDGYLREAHLALKLPESMQYAAVNDGAARVLLGLEADGHIALYVYSAPAKLALKDLVESALKEVGAKFVGKGEPLTNRAGQAMSVFKGSANEGFEFQAYFVKPAKSPRTYAFVLVDRALRQHPAAVREMVESLKVN